MKSEVPLEGVLRVRARRMAVEGLANATRSALAPYRQGHLPAGVEHLIRRCPGVGRNATMFQ
jgi:hypothetical protein